MRNVLRNLLLLPSALLAATLSFVQAADIRHDRLGPRQSNSSSSIAPIGVSPDGSWRGIDGNWSTFELRVGTPAQDVHVLVSFNLYQTWVVLPQGCSAASSPSACATARGGTFDPSSSSTWSPIGIYAFAIGANLGYGGNAQFGYDSVGLGADIAAVQNTTIGGFAVQDFYLGFFGVNPKSTNFTAEGDGAPSYMTLLKRQNRIPSVSFGYSAGASYRGVGASLTLGGYDTARFVNNSVSLQFAADPQRDTVVAIQGISTPSQVSASSPVGTALLPTAIYAFLDSSFPEIWLPLEACRAFENEFGLVYDSATELYLVNNTLHQQLLARNASITFTLGQNLTNSAPVAITLPYAAFDQPIAPPYQGVTSNTRYFPLRRAQNDTQYTLGRVFFQEAYLTVDYERGTFQVAQSSWTNPGTSNLVAIPANTGNGSGGGGSSGSGRSGLSGGAIAGIVIGAVAAALLLALLLFLLWRRRRRHTRRSNRHSEKAGLIPTTSDSDERAGDQPFVMPKAELEGSTPAVDPRLLSAPGSSSGDGPSPLSNRSPTSVRGAGAFLFSSPSRNRNRDSGSQPSRDTHDQSGSGGEGTGTYSSTHSGHVGAAAAAAAGGAAAAAGAFAARDGGALSPLTHSHSHSSSYSTSQSGTGGGGALASSGADTSSSHQRDSDPQQQHRVLVHEMLGDYPAVGEKDGRALSEKEAHEHRERVYNGVDVGPSPATTAGAAAAAAHLQRPAPPSRAGTSTSATEAPVSPLPADEDEGTTTAAYGAGRGHARGSGSGTTGSSAGSGYWTGGSGGGFIFSFDRLRPHRQKRPVGPNDRIVPAPTSSPTTTTTGTAADSTTSAALLAARRAAASPPPTTTAPSHPNPLATNPTHDDDDFVARGPSVSDATSPTSTAGPSTARNSGNSETAGFVTPGRPRPSSEIVRPAVLHKAFSFEEGK